MDPYAQLEQARAMLHNKERLIRSLTDKVNELGEARFNLGGSPKMLR